MKSLEIDLEIILIVVIVCAVLYMFKSGQLCNLIKPSYDTFALGAHIPPEICRHVDQLKTLCKPSTVPPPLVLRGVVAQAAAANNVMRLLAKSRGSKSRQHAFAEREIFGDQLHGPNTHLSSQVKMWQEEETQRQGGGAGVTATPRLRTAANGR